MKQYVVFSHDPWLAAPSRTQQLVTRLGEAQVLVFQPAAHANDRAYKEGGRMVRPDVTLFTLPPDSALAQRHSFFQSHSLRRQAAYVEKQLAKHRFREPALWLTCPDQVPFLDQLAYRGIIYDCDRFWPDRLEEEEAELASAADVVFAASPQLRSRLSRSSSNVALLPNGANHAMFCRSGLSIPEELASLLRPILGWVGVIDRFTDVAPLLCAAGRHPEWTLVLLGSVEDCPGVRQLMTFSNVVFLGSRPAIDLPDFLFGFQVLLNLRRKGDAESDIIPSRLYEYLSTGKPIVSQLLPDEVEDFPDVIYNAQSPEEFVRLCERALQELPTWVAPRRQKYGADAAWSRRAEEVRRILQSISL